MLASGSRSSRRGPSRQWDGARSPRRRPSASPAERRTAADGGAWLPRPARLVSGGQSGVDRAALDFAISRAIPYGGWCPRGGWAEDRAAPPGLLADYPALRETASADPAERTRLNVRDSDATLILGLPTHGGSAGTESTAAAAAELGRPVLSVQVEELLGQAEDLGPGTAQEARSAGVRARIERRRSELPDVFTLNVAGPRQSEAIGDAYASALRALELLLG